MDRLGALHRAGLGDRPTVSSCARPRVLRPGNRSRRSCSRPPLAGDGRSASTSPHQPLDPRRQPLVPDARARPHRSASGSSTRARSSTPRSSPPPSLVMLGHRLDHELEPAFSIDLRTGATSCTTGSRSDLDHGARSHLLRVRRRRGAPWHDRRDRPADWATHRTPGLVRRGPHRNAPTPTPATRNARRVTPTPRPSILPRAPSLRRPLRLGAVEGPQRGRRARRRRAPATTWARATAATGREVGRAAASATASPSSSPSPTATRCCSATAARPRSGTPPRFGLIERRSPAPRAAASSRRSSRPSPAAAPHLDDPEVIESRAGHRTRRPSANADVDAYCFPHNETSTGVHAPGRSGPTARPTQLVLVDATSGAGGLRVDPRAVRRLLLRAAEVLRRRRRALARAVLPRGDRAHRAHRAPSDRWVPPSLDLGIARRAVAPRPDLQHARAGDAVPPRRPGRVDARQRRARVGGGPLRRVGRRSSTAGPTQPGTRRRSSPTRTDAATSPRPSTSTTRSTPPRSPRRCAPTASSTSSRTASSAATSCASRCSPRSSPTTWPRSPARSTTSSSDSPADDRPARATEPAALRARRVPTGSSRSSSATARRARWSRRCSRELADARRRHGLLAGRSDVSRGDRRRPTTPRSTCRSRSRSTRCRRCCDVGGGASHGPHRRLGRASSGRSSPALADLGADLPDFRPGCGSRTHDPDIADAHATRSAMTPAAAARGARARRRRGRARGDVRTRLDRRAPVVPPTAERVARMLARHDPRPDDIVAVDPARSRRVHGREGRDQRGAWPGAGPSTCPSCSPRSRPRAPTSSTCTACSRRRGSRARSSS